MQDRMSFTDSFISYAPKELYFVVYVDYENYHTTKKIFDTQKEAKDYYDSLKRLFVGCSKYEMSNIAEDVVSYYYETFFTKRKIGEISMVVINL